MSMPVSVREAEFGGTISPSQGSDSSDEDSSEVAIAPQEVDDGSDDSSSSSGPAVREDEGKTEEDTDTDEDEGGADEDEDEKGQQGFTNNGEPEFKPKKVKFAKTCLMFETHLLNTHIHITHSKAHFYTKTAVAQKSLKT